MKEAYLLTGHDRPEPEPATLAEALAAIERSRALTAEADALAAKLRVKHAEAYKPMYDLYRRADNYPYKVMEALGYAPGQVRREIATGREYVVTRMAVGGCYLQAVTTRRTVGRELGRSINPLKYRHFEDTGRRVNPAFRDQYGGQHVPKAKRGELPLLFPQLTEFTAQEAATMLPGQ